MTKITAQIGTELYKTIIHSPSGNVLISDEPESVGGRGLGFDPKELLASSLAACTSATLRMYADRKGWDLKEVNIEIELDRDNVNNQTNIQRKVTLTGNLDETQRTKLLAIANLCPLHKILSNPIEIDTILV